MKKLLLILFCPPILVFSQCDLPNNILISDTTHYSFTINFDPVINADFYKIKYREVSTSNWIWVHIGGGNSTTINNLSTTTCEYGIRTTCTTGSNSAWSQTYQVTTHEIYGCLDDRAINYNSLATQDDGTNTSYLY